MNTEISKPYAKELVEARRRLAKATEEAKKLRAALHKELGLEPNQPLPGESCFVANPKPTNI